MKTRKMGFREIERERIQGDVVEEEECCAAGIIVTIGQHIIFRLESKIQLFKEFDVKCVLIHVILM